MKLNEWKKRRIEIRERVKRERVFALSFVHNSTVRSLADGVVPLGVFLRGKNCYGEDLGEVRWNWVRGRFEVV